MSTLVETDLHDGVARVRINRPHRRNALTGETTDALIASLTALAANPECRAVLLSGAGGFFCAGWDISEFPRLAALPDAELMAMFRRNYALLDLIEGLGRPVIAVIEGGAIGFGVSLAARCRIVLSATDARFSVPELSHGLVPGMVICDLIAAIGKRRALDWMLSGRQVNAEEACVAGLVSRIVDSQHIDAQADELARAIARLDTDAADVTCSLADRIASSVAFSEAAIEAAVASVKRLTVKQD